MARGHVKFQAAAPFTVPMVLLIPEVGRVQGVGVKRFPEPENGVMFWGSFRTFGGTERDINGTYTLEDTATVNTWFNPDITADCRVYLPDTGKTYEVLGTPEDIDMRHQYMQFKVRAVGGVA